MNLRTLLLIFLSVFACSVMAIETKAGAYSLNVYTDPPKVAEGQAQLLVEVDDTSGNPVVGANVRAIASMPGMYMGEIEQQGVPVAGEPGKYSVPVRFPMKGAYEVKVTVNGPQGTSTATIPMETGKLSTESAGGSFWLTALWVALGIAAIAFVISRMRKTGQRVDVKPVFTRQVLTSLLVLIGAIAIAVYAVNNFRREGAMTPIEAQVMDMSAPPPEGTPSVTLVATKRQSIADTITYTGQAVGFVEQEVVPRVTGTIVWMPFYVGDKVKEGQVLARLDTTQIDPEVAMRGAAVDTAQQGVTVATSEYNMALGEVAEARAEVSAARGMVAEAQAMLDAAIQGRGTAAAEIASAEAEVDAMQAELQAMESENQFAQAELGRMKQLLASGAVSRSEFQQAEAEAGKAAAAVRQARERVRKARSMVASAQAMAKRVEAEITAARRKVQQAQAEVRAAEAQVRKAQAGAEAAKRRIDQARAGVRESVAGLRGATTQRGYSELKATVDGVITERLISPGVTVNPGQAVLRVAQVSPIRLQANVSESDLARISEGSLVRVKKRGTNEPPVVAKVTSIAPSVDPNARTGVVEAVYPNPNQRFMPGQFVEMEIAISEASQGLVIPANAIQTTVQPGAGVLSSETTSWVWKAEPVPGQSGRFTVARTEIVLGARSEGLVEVKTGLSAGDQVVVQGGTYLRGGQLVASAEPTVESSGIPVVEVRAAGYSPPSIRIEAGKAQQITFIRLEEEGCGDQLVIPKLNITRDLPLNKPVTVELPPQEEGELSFTCGMDMMKGKVVVR